MDSVKIEAIIKKQKEYFSSGATLPIRARKTALNALLRGLETNEEALLTALKKDLGKSAQEGYMCEIALIKSEIRYLLRHVAGYAKEHRVHTPLGQTFSHSFVKPVPYGSVLIMSPWNYPLLLSLEPLADAIAAGNTAVIKPSAYAPAVSDQIQKLISSCFSPELVTVITGGRAENTALMDAPFDYIFFTGSKSVGKKVMCKASERLIPVTLELGGKSPCLVDETADIKLAARRIVFGKFINCGQTCVAPDYIYCAENIRENLIKELQAQIQKQYGGNALQNPNYGKIVNQKHFDRLCGLIDRSKVVYGGESDPQTLQIAPTILDRVTWQDPIMQEEIFGPLLPVLTFQNLEEAAAKINSLPSPLALYHFSSNRQKIRFVKERIQFGGGCINDTLIHLATSQMGFGGVGESGIGSYHGKCGFDAFSHRKSIVDKKTFLDLPMRYQPYNKFYGSLIRLFVR
ncbi:MAG: aldehyde dehydrogenase [Lachnospiraceae bacterium]|nr:aldehyde dehydrogenase [Lachnospiraceae bacterium]